MFQTMLQQLQWLAQFVLPILVLVLVYFLGRIKPIGTMYAICLCIPGKFFLHCAKWLAPFSSEKKTKESEYPGLRTILLSIALILSCVAFSADSFSSLQALQSLWGDAASFTMPDLPSFLTYSMALLYITVPALFGFIWWEQRKVIEKEAKLFSENEKFETFIGRMFTLSVVASVAFYSLRVAYLADSKSHITILLQGVVFVLMGLLLPVIGAICVYINALGLQAIASVVLTGAWVLACLLTDVTRFLCLYFSGNEISPDDRTEGIKIHQRGTTLVTITQEVNQELLDREELRHLAAPSVEKRQEDPLAKNVREPQKKASVLVPLIRPLWIEQKKAVPLDAVAEPVTVRNDTQIISEQSRPVPKEDTPKDEQQAAPAAAPSDTVPVAVPSPSPKTLAVNSNKNAKNGRGRGRVKKEK